MKTHVTFSFEMNKISKKIGYVGRVIRANPFLVFMGE